MRTLPFKKIIISIPGTDKSAVYGALSDSLIEDLCEQTGLNEEQFIDRLHALEALGIIETEYATMH